MAAAALAAHPPADAIDDPQQDPQQDPHVKESPMRPWNRATAPLLMLIAAASLSPLARAQDAPAVHPFLSDDVSIQLGIFKAQKDVRVRVDGGLSVEQREIDFESEFNNSKSDDVFAFEVLWRFSPSWSLRAQSFSASSSSAAVLRQDISWGDTTIGAGSNVEAGTSLEITRLSFGRSFDSRPKHDYGAGIGMHWLRTGAFLRGELVVLQSQSSDLSASGPMPNIGAWYYYSPTPKLYFGGRADWFRASIGDYGGGIVNFAIGANYQLTKHIGIGAKYQDFRLSADISKPAWNGRIELDYEGAFVFLSGNW